MDALIGLIVYLIVYLFIGYLPIGIAAYSLMRLADYQRRWRAWIPLWGLLMLADLAEQSRFMLLLLFVPFINLVVLALIAGDLADLTGRPKWVGFVAGFWIVHIVGLPILAITASSENNLPREFMPGNENEFRYRYRDGEQNAAPLASGQSNARSSSIAVGQESTAGRAQSDSQKRALARIKAYLDEGHSLDALRGAGWSDWIEHLESDRYDLRIGERRIEPPTTEPPPKPTIEPPRSAPSDK